MPTKSASPIKKGRLTLAQLTSYDDIITDALVDHVRCAGVRAVREIYTEFEDRSITGQPSERTGAHTIHPVGFEKKMSPLFSRSVSSSRKILGQPSRSCLRCLDSRSFLPV